MTTSSIRKELHQFDDDLRWSSLGSVNFSDEIIATREYVQQFISGGGGGDYVITSPGDGLVDDAIAIQEYIDGLELGTEVVHNIIVMAPSGGYIYINGTVNLTTSNTRLHFASPVRYGSKGRIRIQGELQETPTVNKPILTVDALAGSTTLTVNNAAPFAAGDYLVLRGARDATGNPAEGQKFNATVLSVLGNVITLDAPTEEDLLAYNINPDSPEGTSHESQVTKVVSSALTVNAARGDTSVTVASTADYAVGDIVQVMDDAHTIDPDGDDETSNFVHREMAEVVAVTDATHLRLNRALYHPYTTAKKGRVAKTISVHNSIISGAQVTWDTMSVVGNAFEISYAVNCGIENCEVIGNPGTGKSWRNQAFRVNYSLYSWVDHCVARNPQDTSSGRGYGFTLYGATDCSVSHCRASSTRHAVLFFNGAAGNIVSDVVSEDCCISDFDFHGAECVDNIVTDCIAIGGASEADDGPFTKSVCKIGNTAHTNGDHYNVFNNIHITNYPGAAICLVPESRANIFRNIYAMQAETAMKIAANSGNVTLETSMNRVENSTFTLTTDRPLDLDGGVNSIIAGLTFDNCTWAEPVDGINVENIDGLTFRSCVVRDPLYDGSTYAATFDNVTGLRVIDCDFSGLINGIKITDCPAARITRNTFHDLTSTNVLNDGGGNTGALFAHNDIHGFAQAINFSGTPSAQSKFVIYDPYEVDHPKLHSWVEWNYDPMATGTATGQATTTGTLYLLKLIPAESGTVNNIIMNVGSTAPAAALTSDQNFAGIYDQSGNLVATTADQTIPWATAGIVTMSLTAPLDIVGGRQYYIAVLSNSGAGTAAVFVRNSGGSVVIPNQGLTNATRRFAVNGTGQTSLPGTRTLSSNTASGAQSFWFALS